MTDRFGIIGASEVAGLLKEYKDNLLAEGIINDDIHNKLSKMPSYLETRYSLARKLMLDREQFAKYQANYDGTKKLIKTKGAEQTAKNFNRGKKCEELVKDDYLNQFLKYDGSLTRTITIVEEQTMKEKIIKGCRFPFRATIDYLLSNDLLLECKTTDINYWYNIEKEGCPFNYEIQANAQMWLHEKEKCNIHIAGIETTKTQYKILESQTFNIAIDRQIIRAIAASLVWFSSEFEKGTLLIKNDDDKVKKDKEIDEFLEIEKGTLELALQSDLSTKLSRLKELEEAKKEYDKLDKEIREYVRKSMAGYSMASFKSNEFKIEAKYSGETYHDEASINEAIEKAKSINIGDVKSVKRLTIKY